MQSYYIEKITDFHEKNLHSNWARTQFDIQDDCIIAFSGAYKPLKHPSLPGSKKKVNPKIFDFMLQFFVKHKRLSFREAETRRRLLIEFMKTELGDTFFSLNGHILHHQNQLSISSIHSNLRASLFHIAFFIHPLPKDLHILSLDQLDIDPKAFALQVVKRYCEEIKLIYQLSLNQL